ncbi:Hypothetical protein CGL2_11346193 : Putative uncharacterized protein OS=Leptospirillum sp. Group II '5-way CG' GN=CGL2_11346193 PE=4 SV=1: Toprim_2: DUF3987 [Gemmataceae bacterium]|nr:Hypothetical protein CGL2_11346193 : Putative uncharacterized protein OS=Leptospirillum sp. Group II '5-way CG' GN=CGL2_11346193 PE=4 SV=1: Toprim_2: DUF3987 [Gemmataceae bacterium]VTT97981.1 Hypothetical protein CGL2_11346193 : Putative uncharacterized protein OS=Leptospirillum sp. Group II '5-way CG' GN=CGL2_11346193 PE=4 SV=1: Toprim_2: DUF3987 [Gemmataceae bacterium]
MPPIGKVHCPQLTDVCQPGGKAPGYLRLFELFGVDFRSDADPNRQAECPFCGKDKFYANVITGQYVCHSANTCGEKGNAYTFVNAMHRAANEDTTDDLLSPLGEVRGLSVEVLKRHGVVWCSVLGKYLLPAFNREGNVQTALRLDATNPKSRELLPGLPQALFGLNHLSSDRERPLFICEGPWDYIAADEHLRGVNSRDDIDVVAAPSATTFKPDWVKYFEGRLVYLCFDNDKAGRDGHERIRKLVAQIKVPCKLHLLQWPAGTAEGYDVRDLLTDGGDLVEFTKANSIEAEPGLLNNLICSTPPKPTCPTLGEAAYNGWMGDFIRFVSPLTEATDACVLAHLLPAIGTTLGPNIAVFKGDNQPPRINTAVVGPSATGRKGTGFVLVKQVLTLADEIFWEKQPVKGLSSGEGLIVRVQDKVVLADSEVPVSPVEKRAYVLEPEFSKVLANTRRQGNTLSQIMREVYDSGNLSTLTVNPREAWGAHISITGHITPDELKARLSSTDMVNGFANRFLWFHVVSEKRLPHSEPVSDKDMMPFAKRLQRVFQFGAALTRRTPVGKYQYKLDQPAAKFWETIYTDLQRAADRPGFIGDLLARGPSHVLRLALIYAITDLKDFITIDHLQAAMALWEYNVRSVEFLFSQKAGDSLEDKLYNLLAHGPLTMREFYRHIGGSKAVDIHAALEQMERNGLIEQSTGENGIKKAGRPAQRWVRVQ